MTIHAATLSAIRQELARIPAGPGRSADEYVEDLRRTLDCMEVAERLETPAEPLRLREGGYYKKRRNGAVMGPMSPSGNTSYPWTDGVFSWSDNGCFNLESPLHGADLIAEIMLSEDATSTYVDTILTPTVPVTVDLSTKWFDERGYLSATAVALFTGLNAQIAELRKMIEREVG